MTSRDEYLKQFKANLDDWNAQIDKLEEKAREAQTGAKAQYEKQLELLHEMRDEAQKNFSEMQNATTAAWDVMLQGTEKAWHTWVNAFEDARSKFKPKD
jgi:DNA anti-recombination protein RmuC